MVNRIEVVKLKQKLKTINVNIDDILFNLNNFYDYINCRVVLRKGEIKVFQMTMNAELYADATKRLLKNYLSPEQNDLIKAEKENYDWFVDNLGRIESATREMRKQSIKIAGTPIDDLSLKILSYKNLLIDVVNHLVFYTLKNAYIKYEDYEFKDKYEHEVPKDLKLFWYLVFQEYFHSSESLGSITGQEIKGIPSSFGITTSRPSRSRTSRYTSPYSGIPEGDSEEIQEIDEPPIEEMFSEPEGIGGDDAYL